MANELPESGREKRPELLTVRGRETFAETWASTTEKQRVILAGTVTVTVIRSHIAKLRGRQQACFSEFARARTTYLRAAWVLGTAQARPIRRYEGTSICRGYIPPADAPGISTLPTQRIFADQRVLTVSGRIQDIPTVPVDHKDASSTVTTGNHGSSACTSSTTEATRAARGPRLHLHKCAAEHAGDLHTPRPTRRRPPSDVPRHGSNAPIGAEDRNDPLWRLATYKEFHRCRSLSAAEHPRCMRS
ncbi:hypothetical protein L226DRAFT_594851 [Lentinus tigrinus ALCF2SS1-7]|uniref:uncharacterized protein n=1 Tax=Lentinus tigrinus ALCF2SS1-7 TaxID=1328758 RepID=UPI0011660627|nr:hypothetical protein L226DRAFT_594851 [Lentinus tigrinus ALCF2SS1-7]